MYNIDFLMYTLKTLEMWGKTEKDVLWVGTQDGQYAMSWQDFKKQAPATPDDRLWCSMSIVVVGKDWWLEAHEYDSSFWWEFKNLPVLQTGELQPFDLCDYEKLDKHVVESKYPLDAYRNTHDLRWVWSSK